MSEVKWTELENRKWKCSKASEQTHTQRDYE